jgi:hypothetical protein
LAIGLEVTGFIYHLQPFPGIRIVDLHNYAIGVGRCVLQGEGNFFGHYFLRAPV